jgi:hypothetical protein
MLYFDSQRLIARAELAVGLISSPWSVVKRTTASGEATFPHERPLNQRRRTIERRRINLSGIGASP